MKITHKSAWDIETLSFSTELAEEIEYIDKANRRKKKALRQMNKAIQRNLAYIDELEDTIIDLQNQLDSEVDNELEAELWEGW